MRTRFYSLWNKLAFALMKRVFLRRFGVFSGSLALALMPFIGIHFATVDDEYV